MVLALPAALVSARLGVSPVRSGGPPSYLWTTLWKTLMLMVPAQAQIVVRGRCRIFERHFLHANQRLARADATQVQ
jgi:hypothetical protein